MTIKEMAKKNFERGLWTIEMLQRLVEVGKLSAIDYQEITGEEYTSYATKEKFRVQRVIEI